MNCPKCESVMEKVNFEGVEVDKCTKCKGIWFDAGEEKKLLNMKNSELIDDGDKKSGEELNKIGRINCPICGSKMTKMVDVVQTHIWYEKCVNHGSFFDAGEFKDLKESNLSDGMKTFFVKLKGGREI